MSAISEKISKRALQKRRGQRRKKQDIYEAVGDITTLADGRKIMRRLPITIPGYTYLM